MVFGGDIALAVGAIGRVFEDLPATVGAWNGGLAIRVVVEIRLVFVVPVLVAVVVSLGGHWGTCVIASTFRASSSQRLLPEVAPAANVQIAKPGDQVTRVVKDRQSGRDQARSFGFDTDSKGDVRFTFRRLEHVARGGSRGRGRGQRDGVSRTDALEPQLGMEKVDTAGKPIAAATKSGAWRVAAVALPLREVVRAGGYSPHRPLPTPAPSWMPISKPSKTPRLLLPSLL